MNQSIAIALVLAVTVAGWILFRPVFFTRPLSAAARFWLGLFQLIPLFLLIVLLLDPITKLKEMEHLERTVVVVVDDSPSMRGVDDETGLPRMEQVKEWVDGLEETAGEETNLSIHHLSDLIPPGRSGSDFAEAFHGLRRHIPAHLLSAVVFISDGADHGEQSPIGAVSDYEVPVHTVGVGVSQGTDFLEAKWMDVPERAQPGLPFLVRWRVDSVQTEPRAVQARISIASEEVWVGSHTLGLQGDRWEEWVSLTTSSRGTQSIRLEIVSGTPPKTLSEIETSISLDEEPDTLLVFEPSPSRTLQTLTQTALKAGRYRVQRAIGTEDGEVVVLWEASRPLGDGTSSDSRPWGDETVRRIDRADWGETSKKLLSEAAVIILGSNCLRGMPAGSETGLLEYLEKARTPVLLLPGCDEGFDSLPDNGIGHLISSMGTLRGSKDSIRLSAQAASRNHPALAPLWSYLDEGWEVGPDSYFTQLPLTATTIFTDQRERPLVWEARFSLSRAILISLSETWKLRAFSGSGTAAERASRFLDGFWLGILDYLSRRSNPSREPKVHALPPNPSVGQSVRIVVGDPNLIPGPPVGGLQMRKEGDDWKNILLSPDPEWAGLGNAVWTPRDSGSYQVRYASAESLLQLEVSARPAESDDHWLDAPLLQSLATKTGGEYFPFDRRGEVFDRVSSPPLEMVRTERRPIRHNLWAGILLALWFCCGWGIRRILSLP